MSQFAQGGGTATRSKAKVDILGTVISSLPGLLNSFQRGAAAKEKAAVSAQHESDLSQGMSALEEMQQGRLSTLTAFEDRNEASIRIAQMQSDKVITESEAIEIKSMQAIVDKFKTANSQFPLETAKWKQQVAIKLKPFSERSSRISKALNTQANTSIFGGESDLQERATAAAKQLQAVRQDNGLINETPTAEQVSTYVTKKRYIDRLKDNVTQNNQSFNSVSNGALGVSMAFRDSMIKQMGNHMKEFGSIDMKSEAGEKFLSDMNKQESQILTSLTSSANNPENPAAVDSTLLNNSINNVKLHFNEMRSLLDGNTTLASLEAEGKMNDAAFNAGAGDILRKAKALTDVGGPTMQMEVSAVLSDDPKVVADYMALAEASGMQVSSTYAIAEMVIEASNLLSTNHIKGLKAPLDHVSVNIVQKVMNNSGTEATDTVLASYQSQLDQAATNTGGVLNYTEMMREGGTSRKYAEASPQIQAKVKRVHQRKVALVQSTIIDRGYTVKWDNEKGALVVFKTEDRSAQHVTHGLDTKIIPASSIEVINTQLTGTLEGLIRLSGDINYEGIFPEPRDLVELFTTKATSN